MPGRLRGGESDVRIAPPSAPLNTIHSNEGNQRPGRRDPVRGDPSQQQFSESRPERQGPSAQVLSLTRAVPISNHIASNYFPPSPPSTIASSPLTGSPSGSSSPQFSILQLGRGDHDTILEEEEEPAKASCDRDQHEIQVHDDHAPGDDMDANGSQEKRIGDALQTHLSMVEGCSRPKDLSRSSCGAARLRPSASSRLPETPVKTPNNMSPACDSLVHQPLSTSRQFLTAILSDFPVGNGSEQVVGSTEDAELDLVCAGWSGAILDRSRLHTFSSVPLSTSHTSVASSSSVLTRSSEAARALYALLPSDAQAERLREDLLAILDSASEVLHCDVVFTILDRSSLDEPDWKALLHGLCYVGGSVVTGGKERLTGCTIKPGFVLVAVEI